MGVIDGLRETNYVRLAWTILIFVPYIDKEIAGAIPIVRDIVPGTPEFRWLEMSWTERLRLAIFIVAPVLDGELVELGGVDLETWVYD